MYTRFASWGSSIFGPPSLATGGGWPFWEGARRWTFRCCCTVTDRAAVLGFL
ncbi:hypothetical protein ZEAMMB73_Zm00001d018604 [Zea mays]|uniref:Uncharacterized protein n=1 Tax=Zea mays TaxID=4577 RepID=A0A1D6HQL2_MAIZE|nr:hypothetical protein ZEAMMB73_Zm00001d018604 [Zea mays]